MGREELARTQLVCSSGLVDCLKIEILVTFFATCARDDTLPSFWRMEI